MKILELTHFSSGICGVYARVKQEASLLSKKNHEVMIFSSNAVKGSSEIAKEHDILDNIKIKRFPFKKYGGESFMSWNFQKDALEYKPDIIICHSYRHLHTTKALKVAKILNKNGVNTKVFLVTHAPFQRKRKFPQNLIVFLYDFFIGKRKLKKFDKVIAITKWEIPYLQKLGLEINKISYIPNGLSKEFFSIKKQAKEENKILFIGRISPIKNLEVLIRAIPKIEDKKIILEIVGPREEDYYQKIKKLIKDLNLEDRVIFSDAIYDIKKKIKKIDSAKIFVLPSFSEGMPQSLIEALSQSKIVIASSNPASKDIIVEDYNGFIFENNNENDLANKINLILNKKNQLKIKSIQKNAAKSSRKFSWDILIEDLTNLF